MVAGLMAQSSPFVSHAQNPASLFVGSSGGTFTVGSTFTMPVYVNTGGNDINAIDASLRFPVDKLQVVTPTAGKSLIQIWVSQPTYDNRLGVLRFQGALPSPGINTSSGLISQVTFRVVGLGTAIVRFSDESKVLLNDGKGTNILGQTTSGLFHLVLPPPAGPIVTSPTHPDQERWYSNKSVALEWGSNDEKVEGYSYILSEQPVEFPDDIPEGEKASVTYKNLPDGARYFHIKSLRGGSWGGVTHFALRIDAAPPAEFPVEVAPSARTTVHRPAINFATTDEHSGIDHYEVRIIPLAPAQRGLGGEEQNFFIETTSPYVPELEFGNYDAVVRAYDRAGNYLQQTARLEIVTHVFDILGDQGIKIRSNVIIPWLWVFVIAGILILGIGYTARVLWHRHHELHTILSMGGLPPDVLRQLAELKALKERYKQLVVFLVAASLMSFFIHGVAFAEQVELGPPIIDVVSRNVSNQDIFYVGGVTDAPGSQINLFIQNLQTGETLSELVGADQKGQWFYSHPSFLSSGRYLLWAQSKVGNITSPPSPQIELTVSQTALQLGSSRLSYEVLYLAIALILAIVLATLIGIALYYHKRVREKYARVRAEARSAEESIRRGFALLHRDIEEEFKLVQQAKLSRGLSAEEKALEEKLMRDLQSVKNYIGKEVWEIEKEVN
jgi:hypothetical protein